MAEEQKKPADIQASVIRHALRDMDAGMREAAQDQKAAPKETHKIGEGHAAAMLRLGLKELTQVLPAFPDATIKTVEEPGLYGNPTQIMVTRDIDKEGRGGRGR